MFLLRLKTFHANAKVKKAVLALTVSLCSVFPITAN